MKLTKKVEALVRARGMTNHQLEKELGFSNGTVKRWDESSPSIEKVMKLAKYFDITVDQFLDIEPNEKFTVAWESLSQKTVIVYAKSKEEALGFWKKGFCEHGGVKEDEVVPGTLKLNGTAITD